VALSHPKPRTPSACRVHYRVRDPKPRTPSACRVHYRVRDPKPRTPSACRVHRVRDAYTEYAAGTPRTHTGACHVHRVRGIHPVCAPHPFSSVPAFLLAEFRSTHQHRRGGLPRASFILFCFELCLAKLLCLALCLAKLVYLELAAALLWSWATRGLRQCLLSHPLPPIGTSFS